MVQVLAIISTISLAVLAFLTGMFECWDSRRKRPKTPGYVLGTLVLIVTIVNIVFTSLASDQKADTQIDLDRIAIDIDSDLNWSIEALGALPSMAIDSRQELTSLGQIQGSLFGIRSEFERYKNDLIKKGFDPQMLVDFICVLKASEVDIISSAGTLSEKSTLAKALLDQIRRRFAKELLRAKARIN